MKKTIWLILGLFLWVGCSPMHQIRYTPARWVRDNDRQPIKQPALTHEYKYSDILEYQLFSPLERLVNVAGWFEAATDNRQEALNTNNFDEVADSTWFTNRIGRREMSLEEFRRGPNRGSGPDTAGPWQVLKGKTVGGTPGLIIQDAQGERYLLKFEPLALYNLATGAEMVSTKILYALGFNVPENYIVDFKPEILEISPGATQKVGKKKGPLTQKDLDHMFNRMPQKGGGVYRALASKFIPGKPMGPFSFRGRRRGDRNDRIPHQHRRELRGYRVFSALLNHTDSRQANTFDAFMEVASNDKGYILHYLIDFGSTLGSGTILHKTKRHLDDYYFNYGKVAGSFLTLGGYQPDWEQAQDPDMLSVGLYEAKSFDPKKWKPPYPNPAFQNMTKRDAFWAAKILMRISDRHMAAAVEEGQYESPKAREYLTRTLIARRNKTARAWFAKVNPLDNFQILPQGQGALVQFEDLMIKYGLESAGSANYIYRIKQDSLMTWRRTSSTELALPATVLEGMKPGRDYYLQIRTKRHGESWWSPLIELVLKKDGQLKLMGLARRYQKTRDP